MTWRNLIACCISKATNTHSEYVILIDFPLRQWLYKRLSVLRHTLPILLNYRIWFRRILYIEIGFLLPSTQAGGRFIRSRVQKFPVWHTKAAPNGKCCEGCIVPSMVRLMYQFHACWNKGRLCWKIAKLFYFCHLKKLVRPETFGPYYVYYLLYLLLHFDLYVLFYI